MLLITLILCFIHETVYFSSKNKTCIFIIIVLFFLKSAIYYVSRWWDKSNDKFKTILIKNRNVSVFHWKRIKKLTSFDGNILSVSEQNQFYITWNKKRIKISLFFQKKKVFGVIKAKVLGWANAQRERERRLKSIRLQTTTCAWFYSRQQQYNLAESRVGWRIEREAVIKSAGRTFMCIMTFLRGIWAFHGHGWIQPYLVVSRAHFGLSLEF